MTYETAGIDELTDEALALLLKEAQAEQARRNSGRMSMRDLSQCFRDAAHMLHEGKTTEFADVNRRLANLGVRMIVVEGRLYLEKASSQ